MITGNDRLMVMCLPSNDRDRIFGSQGLSQDLEAQGQN